MTRHRPSKFATAVALLWLAAPVGPAAGSLQPRPPVVKPLHTVLEAYHRPDVIRVKFHDDAPVRLRDGVLTDFGTGELAEAKDVLAALAGAEWRPLVDAPEADVENIRQVAQQNLGKAVADFRAWFHVFLPPDIDAPAAIDALNALGCVELAEPVQDAAPPPTTPILGHQQPYLNAGPVGLGALPSWEHLGTRGINVNVIDIEFGWEQFHQDLPTVNLIQFGDPPASQLERDHGTATLGVIAAIDNGFGTTGMAPSSILGFAPVRVGGVVNIPQAITNSTINSSPGDIILIELQIAGPAACADPCSPLTLPPCSCGGAFAFVPVEWGLAEYNAIVAAVGNGRVVIEPAGNGAQNLDAAIYQTGHNPFQSDSGAIMVGAGMPPVVHGGLDVERSRVCCSNYGSRIDVQGWGWGVYTTGYGDAYSDAQGQLDYTAIFAGTSSAAATIAGAAALVQSAYEWANNSAVLNPLALRQLLVNSGTSQQSAVSYPFPATQNIGPLPDASIAILLSVGGCLPFYGTTIGNPGTDSLVMSLESFNDGGGNRLFAGGFFTTAGGGSAADLAAWDGTSWSAVGSGPGVGAIIDMLVWYDGNSVDLYAAGAAQGSGGVARWDGSSWTTIGATNGPVNALASFNGSLYAGGVFSDISGTAVSNIARWNGSTWSALGSGTDGNVMALQAHDDGSGNKLYAGGFFTTAGGLPAARIARWNGSSWSQMPGFTTQCHTLAVYDDGNGPALYAGGFFLTFNDQLMKWNGTQWSSVGGGPLSSVDELAVFDDGTGPALYAGGSFQDVTDVWSPGAAKWDGNRWWALGDGVNGSVAALAAHDDGNGKALYVGGSFSLAWDLPASNIVKWSSCASNCPADINGDGTVNVSDFLALLAAWGPNPGHPADINNDGTVSVTDFLLLLAAWGPCP